MTVINQLADFLQTGGIRALPSETRKEVKVHTLDTVGANACRPANIRGQSHWQT